MGAAGTLRGGHQGVCGAAAAHGPTRCSALGSRPNAIACFGWTPGGGGGGGGWLAGWPRNASTSSFTHRPCTHMGVLQPCTPPITTTHPHPPLSSSMMSSACCRQLSWALQAVGKRSGGGGGGAHANRHHHHHRHHWSLTFTRQRQRKARQRTTGVQAAPRVHQQYRMYEHAGQSHAAPRHAGLPEDVAEDLRGFAAALEQRRRVRCATASRKGKRGWGAANGGWVCARPGHGRTGMQAGIGPTRRRPCSCLTFTAPTCPTSNQPNRHAFS